MITAYHRPKTLDEALTLLTQPNTLPSEAARFFLKERLILSKQLTSNFWAWTP